MISEDGKRWDLPAGRPEHAETWEETLRREVWEEACAKVESARLLGFSRGRCVHGSELGLVLVRSIWLAQVSVEPWAPQFEIRHRKLVPAEELFEHLTIEGGYRAIFRKAVAEAGGF